jgi:autotransporter-associated beta strand protein
MMMMLGRCAAAVVTLLAVDGGTEALGVTGTWIAEPDPNGGTLPWEVPANWQDGVVPGSTAGVAGTSTDVALFTTPGGDGTQVAVDLNRNVGGITFDMPTGNGRTIGVAGGNTLYLSDGGIIQVTAASATATNPQIAAPVVLLGSSATFASYSTNSSAGLKPNGNITTAAASGTTTLFLDGVNSSGTLTSNSQVGGTITDGASATISVVKTGTGVWDFRPSSQNTYSGPTILNGGGIRLNSAGALSPNSDVTINGESSLRASVPVTGRRITINTVAGYQSGSTPLSVSGSGVFNLASDSGPAITVNVGDQAATADLALAAAINLTGAVAGEGGFKVTGPAGWRVSFSRPLDLGTVDRTFEVADTPDVSTDLRFTGVVSGSGGIIKTGAGTMKIETSAPTYTGNTTVRAGRLLLTPESWGLVTNGPGDTVLAGGRVELDYSSTGTTPYADVVNAMLTQGRIKAQASPGIASGIEAIAVVDDSAGLSVSLQRAIYGDTDLNGKLNADDYVRIDRGRALGLTGWNNGDVNYDGVINTADYMLIDKAFVASGVPHEALLAQREAEFGSEYVSALIASVPEPSVGMLLVACGLLGRKRDRR